MGQGRLIENLLIPIRFYSKIDVKLSAEIISKLEKGDIKARKHPGTQKYGEICVPKRIQNSILKCIGDYPLKKLINDGNKLSRYITARHPPPEHDFIQRKIKQLEEKYDKQFPLAENIETMNDLEKSQHYNNKKTRIQKMLKELIYSWKPINYGRYESLVYAVGRSALEFTILYRVLSEIKKVDYDFKPRNIFDFGSGIGTGMWASSTLWRDSLFEYYNVDSSKDMNDLADSILRDGNDNQQSNLKNVYFRQFLPAKNIQYDVILSSFSLFELNSKNNRTEVLRNLWKKCGKYLVLIEEGTRSGFELIAEAREIILSEGISDSDLKGYVFAPCPHQYTCPRLKEEENKTPCNFEIQYEPLSLFGKQGNKLSHLYSYLILRKGTAAESSEYFNWPTIVRPTLVRARHTVCRLCTSDGKLQEIIFTASKHGKLVYQCARSSKWGDKLPIQIENVIKKNS